MLKPDRFSCSQKIWLKRDPPLYVNMHTHTYIHTCIYVNVSNNYLFVPNAVLRSICMLYLSPSLHYIDSLCNFPAEVLTFVTKRTTMTKE